MGGGLSKQEGENVSQMNLKLVRMLRKCVPFLRLPMECIVDGHLCVALYGSPGVGKSSLVNTIIATVTEKECKDAQVAEPTFQGGYTLHNSLHHIPDSCLHVVDTRGIGLDDWVSETMNIEVVKHLEGYRDYKSEVHYDKDEPITGGGNVVHCTVIVIDAQANAPQGLEMFVRHLYSFQGRYPIAVVTKVDKVSAERLAHVLEILGVLGFNKNEIFCVANVTPDKTIPRGDTQVSIFGLFQACMIAGREIIKFRNIGPN